MLTLTIQFMPFWPGNVESWFQMAEWDFSHHGITDQRSQFLEVAYALPNEVSKCVIVQVSSQEVSDPYGVLKAALLKKNDLTDRQRLNELFRSVKLGGQLAVNVLMRMREVIG
uniref:DUF7041 domain-containing protein n=1 Tax=Trichobilharzia regenti TaxID=157069 RepID=A0AA85JGT3_TRIRE|nr:unnamed protein product [Trichobilharzia regenti]